MGQIISLYTYPPKDVIFPREGRLWNFGGTHKIHKRFLTKSTGSTCVGKEERQYGNSPHTSVLMDINKTGNNKSIYKVKFGNRIGCLNWRICE